MSEYVEDHLTETCRRMVETVVAERDALRIRVAELESEVARLRALECRTWLVREATQ